MWQVSKFLDFNVASIAQGTSVLFSYVSLISPPPSLLCVVWVFTFKAHFTDLVAALYSFKAKLKTVLFSQYFPLN